VAVPEIEKTLVILDPTVKKGFTAIPNAVVRAPGLSLAAKGMYMILASYVYQFPAGWNGSLETLAGDANCDVATVRRHLAELQDYGLISWQQEETL